MDPSPLSRVESLGRLEGLGRRAKGIGASAVVFDAVGTVLYADPPMAEAYHRLGKRFGSALGLTQIAERFSQAFARQDEQDRVLFQHQTSEPRERERWRAIVADVFVELNDREELFEALWDHFAAPSHWRFYDDVPGAIAEVADCGLAWGIASNFDARLTPILAGLPPLDSCRHVFVSSALGFRKPSRDFFAAIARALDRPPSEILYVGDDWQNDIVAARAAGWQAIYLCRRP